MRSVVSWLENHSLRSLPDAERTSFGASPSGWVDKLSSYCESLGCPFKVTSASGQEVSEPLAWLVDKAVAALFAETGEYEKEKNTLSLSFGLLE